MGKWNFLQGWRHERVLFLFSFPLIAWVGICLDTLAGLPRSPQHIPGTWPQPTTASPKLAQNHIPWFPQLVPALASPVFPKWPQCGVPQNHPSPQACTYSSSGDASGKNSAANAGDVRDAGSNPGSGKSPGKGNGNPLQYSCLENPMDRGAWRATVPGVTKSWTWMRQLSMHACM